MMPAAAPQWACGGHILLRNLELEPNLTLRFLSGWRKSFRPLSCQSPKRNFWQPAFVCEAIGFGGFLLVGSHLAESNFLLLAFSCVRGKRKLMADVRGQFGIDKANKAKEDQKVLADWWLVCILFCKTPYYITFCCESYNIDSSIFLGFATPEKAPVFA